MAYAFSFDKSRYHSTKTKRVIRVNQPLRKLTPTSNSRRSSNPASFSAFKTENNDIIFIFAPANQLQTLVIMKKALLLISICCTFCACNNVEKQAAVKLQEARAAYESGDYNQAKILIDSIKILYPKAYETRKAGIGLMQEVELKEQEKTLHYLDSLLQQKQQQLDAMKNAYVFEKDAEYQRIGRYLHPSQVIEKNLHRSFLRFQVDENGLMSMTSIYCGPHNIHHTAVKASTTDGIFAQTPPSKDSYETTDLGEKIEKADYKMGEDGDIINFIYANRDKNIRIDYLGERPYSTTLTANDRKAAAAVYELAQVLASISEIKKNIDEANLKSEFVKRKMKEREAKEE